MWSVVIHEVWRFFTKHILLSIFTQRRKPSIKFKQRDHLSQKIRESNTVRKSESSTDWERSDRWSSTGGSNGRQRRQGQQRILSEIWLSWGVRWPTRERGRVWREAIFLGLEDWMMETGLVSNFYFLSILNDAV